MPKPGYVSVTLTYEAKQSLDALKRLTGAKSYSELVSQMYDFYVSVLMALSRMDKRISRYVKGYHGL